MTERPCPVIVYHLWPVEGWEETHDGIMGLLKKSGLLNEAQAMAIGWAAPCDWPEMWQAAVDLPRTLVSIYPLRHGMNEVPTLELMQGMAKRADPETPFLYIHCRGARYKPTDMEYGPVRDHNAMMLHLLVEKWREAVAALDGADVAGCNVQPDPFLHVSGNMWWARAGALAALRDPASFEDALPKGAFLERRNTAEAWLGTGIPRARMHQLHGSGGVHHYQQRYPRERYAR